VLLGNSGVGKTALVERATEDIFQKSHIPTVGAQFISLEVQIGEATSILELWDTAGQEVFRSLVGFYARDAKGAFILYDVALRASFDDLPRWLEFTRAHSPDAQIILFGNKIDLADIREVSHEDGDAFARAHGLCFMEGSAKTAENVRDAFEKMTEIVGQVQQAQAAGAPEAAEPPKGCC
jgi:small GTP-binding protein